MTFPNFRAAARAIDGVPKSRFVTFAVLSILAIGFIDHFTGPITSLTIFYLIPVVATAWVAGRLAGNLLAVFAAVGWAVADRLGPLAEPKVMLAYWNDASILSVFVFANFVVSALREQLLKERSLLLDVQRRLLPDSVPKIPEFDLAWRWIPAWTVAGDYYDVIAASDGGINVCLADVSGKGMPAALIMSNVQATVRALSSDGLPPHQVLRTLNRVLFQRLRIGTFVTGFYGLLDPASGRMTYASAGHNPPMLVRRDGTLERLQPTGPAAGILAAAAYDAAVVELNRGDRLLIFSDGVTEYQNGRGEQFGEQRLANAMLAAAGSADHTCDAITNALAQFGGSRPYDDDVTMLLLRRE